MKFKNIIANLMLGAFLIGVSSHHNITRAFITKEEADGITLSMDYVEQKNKEQLKQKLINCAIKNYKSIDPNFDEKTDYGKFVLSLLRQIPIEYRKITIPYYWNTAFWSFDAHFDAPFVKVVDVLKVENHKEITNCVDFFNIINFAYNSLDPTIKYQRLYKLSSNTGVCSVRRNGIEREYRLMHCSTPSSDLTSQISNPETNGETLIFIERFTKAYCQWLGIQIDTAKSC